MEREIKELEQKIRILKNRKQEEEEKLSQVMESTSGVLINCHEYH